MSSDEVRVDMTMTTRACPLHAYFTEAAEAAIRNVAPEARAVTVAVVWDPPWEPAMMSEIAKQLLGWPSS